VLCGGFLFFCIFAVMDFIKDIFINLLSDAILVISGFIFARFIFLKKSSLSSNKGQPVLKNPVLFSYREQLLKKSVSCDLLLKK